MSSFKDSWTSSCSQTWLILGCENLCHTCSVTVNSTKKTINTRDGTMFSDFEIQKGTRVADWAKVQGKSLTSWAPVMHNLMFKTLWVNRFCFCLQPQSCMQSTMCTQKHTVHWRKITAATHTLSSKLRLADPEGSTVNQDERDRSSITLMLWRKSIRTETGLYFCSSDTLPDSISYSHTQ